MKVFSLGTPPTSRAYRSFNKRTFVVEESMKIFFDESNHRTKSVSVDKE